MGVCCGSLVEKRGVFVHSDKQVPTLWISDNPAAFRLPVFSFRVPNHVTFLDREVLVVNPDAGGYRAQLTEKQGESPVVHGGDESGTSGTIHIR